jgi:hypothetical protein
MRSSPIASCGAALLLFAGLLASSEAAAQVGLLAFVATSGNDGNACNTPTAPCRTFQGAHDKILQTGAIQCLDNGDFSALTITKGITIDCSGRSATIQSYGQFGITVNTNQAVHLRDITIDGGSPGILTGFSGIRIINGSLFLERVEVRNTGGNGIEVMSNANYSTLTLLHASVHDNSGHGVYVAPPAGTTGTRASISESILANNGKTGIRVDDRASATVSDTTIANNGTHGVTCVGTAAGIDAPRVTLERVVSTGHVNGGGVLASGPTALIYLSAVVLTNNSYGFYPAQGGGNYTSFQNNAVGGNTVTDGTPTSSRGRI